MGKEASVVQVKSNMETKIKNLIKDALKNLGIEAEAIVLEHPADIKMGDYSTNVAMAYAKALKMNPKELAEKIVAGINKIPEIEKIEVAGPGFINFYLTDSFFRDSVGDVISLGENYGISTIHNGKKILIEHSSPNLFKPFHIGHVMNNAIGESITRLARFSGAEVKCISYPSDVSLGIGKAVWVLLRDGGISKLHSIGNSIDTLSYLGECYVQGTKLYEDDPTIAQEMRNITSILYEKDLNSIEYKIYTEAKEINLAYFKAITSRIGSTFDDFIFESEAGIEGAKIIRENIPNVFEESEGAVIYKGEQDGLHTRVFINKEGYPTYEAKDVGLLSLKFKKYSPDVSIFITDHEQEEYFRVVASAAGKINPIWKEKTVHRTHGRMTFKGQKMSSRLGGVPIALTLIDTLFEEVLAKSEKLDAVNDRDNINAVAVASLKFTILRAMAGKNINFDPETSLSFEGDSGPYLQYVFVRAKSLIQKAQNLGYNPSIENASVFTGMIERQLSRFPEVVEQSISLWQPHHLNTYLIELAQAFNSWYGGAKIIDENNKDISYHLALVQATAQTIKNGLYLLGIKTPEKM